MISENDPVKIDWFRRHDQSGAREGFLVSRVINYV